MPLKPRILVVDDEERFRTTLARMLSLHGLPVLALGSGREALAALAAEAYDVVILDLRMPDLDGLRTLGEIKKLRPDTEVIILTGHASLDAAMEIIKLGGYDYLLKPCPVEDLMLKIDSAWERKKERAKGKGSVASGQ
jgi:DNA-binding NtrC family response regulator